MKRPTPFWVDFYDLEKVAAIKERDGDLELADIEELYSQRDFPNERAARRFVAELEAQDEPPYWRITRRINITDGTPREERTRGLVWDYDEEIFDEAGGVTE